MFHSKCYLIKHFTMKNYLIIGASTGIGKALAEDMAKKGHRIFGTYNNTISENTSNIEFQAYNVLDKEASLTNLPDVIDGFVYCVGSINLKPFARIKSDQFLADYDLQVGGAIRTLQQILPNLKKSEQASVVFFSTVAVQNGFNFHSQVSSSKGAIEGLTRALSAEFAPKIRFNAIAPSLTDTPLASRLLGSDEKKKSNADRHPLKTIGSAENIAKSASFLLSEDSSWMTGQILHPDGGMSSIRS